MKSAQKKGGEKDPDEGPAGLINEVAKNGARHSGNGVGKGHQEGCLLLCPAVPGVVCVAS